MQVRHEAGAFRAPPLLVLNQVNEVEQGCARELQGFDGLAWEVVRMPVFDKAAFCVVPSSHVPYHN